jgi:hypothetical protein
MAAIQSIGHSAQLAFPGKRQQALKTAPNQTISSALRFSRISHGKVTIYGMKIALM